MTVSPLLEIKNLTINFTHLGQKVDVVKDVSFSLNQGEAFCLLGESGAGKSVIALSILKLLPPSCSLKGEVLFKGENLLTASSQTLKNLRGNRISMIFQDPLAALNPLKPISEQLVETILAHQPLTKAQALERAVELLERVHLKTATKRLNDYPHQFSGGECQRIMIAIALSNKPDLLIADEPTTALDVTIQAEILALLKELQQTFKMSLLLITHDLKVAFKIATSIALLKEGRLLERGDKEEILKKPKDPYTQSFINTRLTPIPPFEKKMPVILKGESLSVSFQKKPLWQFKKPREWTLKGINFKLHQGETIGVVGESGSGKTTLALALMHLLKYQGRLFFHSHELNTLSPAGLRPLRSRLQILFQNPYSSLDPRFMVEDILEEGLKVHAPLLSSTDISKRVEAMLEQIGLSSSYRTRYPHELSGGECQRIALGRALILKPEVLILDEPTSSLDLFQQKNIIDLLKDFQEKQNLSYLLISHDMEVISALSHFIMVMKEGKVIEENKASIILKKPHHQYTKKLLSSSLII